jgi:3D (Asp-Asp-Asp) domain-containing protein
MTRFRVPALKSLFPLLVSSACTTAGSAWMAEPLTAESAPSELGEVPAEERPAARAQSDKRTRVIGQPGAAAASGSDGLASPSSPPSKGEASSLAATRLAQAGGRSLGTFRNTYYDFPSEADFQGDKLALKSPRCETIRDVPRAFFETLCVQGSGTLAAGGTVSFAKRDCECAEKCPRTGERICFDLLDARTFPWGRGATGKPITPLLSVAVDSDVVPLGTPLYIPELDGLPREPGGQAHHDGCFLAQDRGIRVKGKHVDVFTGHTSITTLWNNLVPSNQGVTVVLESPRCTRANSP